MARLEIERDWLLRRNKINLILVLILVLLGAYAYLNENSKLRSAPKAQKIEKIFDFDKDDIQEIMLRWQNQTIIFRKERGLWLIKKPWDAPADKGKIKDLLSVFNYGIVRPIDDHPSDYSQYGLIQPEVELGIKGRGDPSFRVLEIGSNDPNHTGCYARVKGEARIILIGVAYKAELQKEASYFRLLQ
ncbi:DUF4340 domain-containing protein [Desulfobacterium sp. N47]|uniref:DUF4340 domain-containing protein n=1 Tax=uncultured Desulfobacterium sp. TaxID=201089 RepID=E1YGL6_9BACT|nr:hypothetical protein N47_F14050 [uncultured Desulfobacterium sp.]